jgi:hypothetical protein
MRNEDQIAGEVDETPLSPRLDLLDYSPNERLIVIHARQLGKPSLEACNDLSANSLL